VGNVSIYRYCYRFGERVVAVDLCIESASVPVPLKTTYDESVRGLSPSSLLRQEAYRHVFEERRVRRFEFYATAAARLGALRRARARESLN
jgi:Acetyltransferase (GNAT) domain